VIGEIPGGLPRPIVPDVSLAGVVSLLLPALGVTFVAFSDNILTARAFASDGERIDAKRELFAVGAANIGAGLLQAFPVSSSGSRTAIGAAAGSRTQLHSLITVACIVAVLLFLRPVLASFPLA